MNLVPSTVPNDGSGNSPSINAFDAQYAVTPLAAATATLTYAPGLYPINYAGVCAITVTAPIAGLPSVGGNDGEEMTFIDTGGHAHTITFPANTIAPSHHLCTFGGTVGARFTVKAFSALGYVGTNSGVTVS
jgi:hypothetical protein